MKKILVALVCLMTAFSLTGCLDFLSKESEVDLETKAIKLAKEVQRGDYKVVSTAELKQMMDADKNLLIVDTMPFEASYKKNHIPGAVQFLFPIPDMNEWDSKETDGKSEEDFKKLLGDDLNRPIVFYCGFVKCTRSHNGAVWARKLGYTNVYRQPGGITAWIEAKYEVGSVK
ncbi:rhodanese-like domain-containing protein [Desulfovibrio mangrovi]|uniref:rhodanese-like domain-containing protein n=1 Tax=Desulfovibrio mangrovi TaxID=2976983 RepID=UPI0022474FC0|nr:rhodanese-like domain-containing protein [Desulfovibrio mangrovi]UZP68976.1 rhodanese-like domain-containing protein [Desulfovibrio mangrovi]